MEYQFIATIHGPAIMGEGEVVYFNQHGQMLDYADADPEFLSKAKDFLAETIRDLANTVADSLTKPVVNQEIAMSLPMYVIAIQHLGAFEHRLQNSNHGFPGPNPFN